MIDHLYKTTSEPNGMGLLPDTQNCRLRMRRECREGFPDTAVSDPDMHHGTCVTHVPCCMPGSLTSDFLWSRWRGKSSWGQYGAHLGPVGPRWAPCWPHESCYQGVFTLATLTAFTMQPSICGGAHARVAIETVPTLAEVHTWIALALVDLCGDKIRRDKIR